MQTLPSISAIALQNCDGVIIDIRTPEEHAEKRLNQAHILVPLDQLDAHHFMTEHNIPETKPVYILCRSGRRAIPAAEKFIGAGYPNVKIIEGGILACEANGIEVV